MGQPEAARHIHPDSNMSYPAPALRVELRPSRKLAAIVVVAHLVAAAILIPVSLPSAMIFGLMLLWVFSLLHCLRRAGLASSPRRIVGLEFQDDEHLAFRTADGCWHPSRLLGTSYVTPALTVLNLGSGWMAARHVVILDDSVDPETFRALRVRLKWCATRSEAAEH